MNTRDSERYAGFLPPTPTPASVAFRPNYSKSVLFLTPFALPCDVLFSSFCQTTSWITTLVRQHFAIEDRFDNNSDNDDDDVIEIFSYRHGDSLSLLVDGQRCCVVHPLHYNSHVLCIPPTDSQVPCSKAKTVIQHDGSVSGLPTTMAMLSVPDHHTSVAQLLLTASDELWIRL